MFEVPQTIDAGHCSVKKTSDPPKDISCSKVYCATTVGCLEPPHDIWNQKDQLECPVGLLPQIIFSDHRFFADALHAADLRGLSFQAIPAIIARNDRP
jgi:hypothetical protein